MTAFNKSTLKTYFETGDVPTGTDYANFIDSYVNIVDTANQSMAGSLQTTELIASRISAGNVNITGTFSAAIFNITTVSAASVYADNLFGGAISGTTGAFSSTVTAATLHVEGIVSATGDVNSRNNLVAGARTIICSGDTGKITAVQGSFAGTVSANSVQIVTGSAGLEFQTVVSGQGVQTATLLTSPIAGNPSFWLPVRINGAVRFIPAW